MCTKGSDSQLEKMKFEFHEMKLYRLFVVLACVCSSGLIQAQQQDELMPILEKELKRELEGLSKAPISPYFIEYRVEDLDYISIQSSFGSLIRSDANRSRTLVTRVKVGDYQVDNTHPVKQGGMYMPDRGFNAPHPLPLENEPLAIEFAIWNATQDGYREALSAYKRVKSSSSESQNSTSTAPDFSKEQPSVFFEAPLSSAENLIDKTKWESVLKKYSSLFLKNPDIILGEANFNFNIQRQHLISNEGTRVAQNFTYAYINISGSIRAEDGDIVPLHLSYFAFQPSELPSEEVITKDINEMITKLEKLKKAPLAEPYTGPAILQSQAAGVFFHEIFGHRVEGHRLKSEMDGQTFKAKVNEVVLPKTMNIIFDPTLTHYKQQPLNGFFKYDDEGVKSRRVNVVEKGVLKTFLMSRSPLEEIKNSNGHGRASSEAEVVSRQSNLIVETDKAVQINDLRKMLVKECQKQGKKYGYFFKDVVGGFTFTNRFTPNAFNIFPTEVYRVYVDGRPDELVRGVDLIGTPLAMFAEIQAAGNDPGIFTGFCGAESGSVPVSAVSPSLFVRRIETQKKVKMNEESTLLSRPSGDQ